MPKTVRIKVNAAAVKALLRGPEAKADITRRTQHIAEAAGAGGGFFDGEVTVGARRVRGAVWTADHEARHREATEHALTSAIDAGRR